MFSKDLNSFCFDVKINVGIIKENTHTKHFKTKLKIPVNIIYLNKNSHINIEMIDNNKYSIHLK